MRAKLKAEAAMGLNGEMNTLPSTFYLYMGLAYTPARRKPVAQIRPFNRYNDTGELDLGI